LMLTILDTEIATTGNPVSSSGQEPSAPVSQRHQILVFLKVSGR